MTIINFIVLFTSEACNLSYPHRIRIDVKCCRNTLHTKYHSSLLTILLYRFKLLVGGVYNLSYNYDYVKAKDTSEVFIGNSALPRLTNFFFFLNRSRFTHVSFLLHTQG